MLLLIFQSYVSTKPFCKINAYERLDLCQECVKNSDWLMIDVCVERAMV